MFHTRSERANTAVASLLVAWVVFYNIGEIAKAEPLRDLTSAYVYGYSLLELGIGLLAYNIATYKRWLASQA